MLFNSLDFAIFLPIVFVLYWFALGSTIRGQNLLIVVASLVFYGWWDWRFLSLLLINSLIDYALGILLGREQRDGVRRGYLWISLVANLGMLGFFKYFNFFVDSFVEAFTLLGYSFDPWTLNIVLPVGISFYTFQTLSYTIDVYRRKMEPTSDLVGFLAFVSFFPQLVAGPIERASHLLPQFHRPREFRYDLAVDGTRQILWGLFKKVVVADNCAEHVNLIFDGYQSYGGSTLLLGAVLFAFQIYCDFSGYSDIAIGTARLFGFELMQNFAFPYFSRDVAEFWRRWHISLSTWFRDYVYLPLGGSRGTLSMSIRNTMIVFIVSGFWHGANWTFLVWGALNALYFLPLLIGGKHRQHLSVVAAGRLLPTLSEALRIAATFSLIVLAWVFFRAESMTQAMAILGEIFSSSLFTIPVFPAKRKLLVIGVVAFLWIVEWIGREHQFALQELGMNWPRSLRWSFYYALCLAILLFPGANQDFIYFQF